jgi:hypothetical protein
MILYISAFLYSVIILTFAMPSSSSKPTIYFGYGSNLWKDQMTQRCPSSPYLGIARLNGYRWLINNRGYANVAQPVDSDQKDSDVVWGLVYSLEAEDERQLDLNEGVPFAYTKELLTVDYWPASNGSKPGTDGEAVEKEMLVYIDRKRVEPDKPKKEYVYRMNMGIKDAVGEGMPQSYVDEVMRKFIPDEEDKDVEGFARQQAVFFEDEEGDESYGEEYSEDGEDGRNEDGGNA